MNAPQLSNDDMMEIVYEDEEFDMIESLTSPENIFYSNVNVNEELDFSEENVECVEDLFTNMTENNHNERRKLLNELMKKQKQEDDELNVVFGFKDFQRAGVLYENNIQNDNEMMIKNIGLVRNYLVSNGICNPDMIILKYSTKIKLLNTFLLTNILKKKKLTTIIEIRYKRFLEKIKNG